MENLTGLESMGISLSSFEASPAICRAELMLREDAAIFRDHFPGRPLLPAIGLIYLCDWMVRRWLGEVVCVGSLKRVRFSEPILPGTALHIQLSRRGADRLRMVASSPAGEHSSGELGLRAGLRPDVEAPVQCGTP